MIKLILDSKKLDENSKICFKGAQENEKENNIEINNFTETIDANLQEALKKEKEIKIKVKLMMLLL